MNLDKMTPAQRKEHPIATGCLAYFPQALLAVAHCSHVGNEQHNPGEPLHWNRAKSQDELDAGIRHALNELKEFASLDKDGVHHIVKTCWRMLAYTEKMLEKLEAEEETEDTTLVLLEEEAQQALDAIRSSRDYIEAEKLRAEEEAMASAREKRQSDSDQALENHLSRRFMAWKRTKERLGHSGVGEGDASLPPIPAAD